MVSVKRVSGFWGQVCSRPEVEVRGWGEGGWGQGEGGWGVRGQGPGFEVSEVWGEREGD